METWNQTQDQKSPVIVNSWNFVIGTSIVYCQRTEVSILKSFNALHSYDFICLSETLLSHSLSSTLDSLNIDGYNIVRSDHPGGSKWGAVCCYFKEGLPIRILKITPKTECLVLELLCNNKLVIISVSFS